ncbi:Methylamine utilization protein MauE [BD1-7 clade bacterium]|uniref:Methylamine utilization protein MauE n=1 Tax=BD1-7 clade bacterium TaxID=2029982 RepID=A0A5S9MYF0_9GAMM|nr:Methylamine utilization protein MauE [BD1-7 clade bacterium]CAA0082600.1 Methylamine utilization protein MauE [BD1-7 clade bacterium]
MTELVGLAVMFFVVLLFLRAASHKALDFLQFQGFVVDYRLLPQPLVVPISASLVVVEIAIVVMLVSGFYWREALFLAASLLLLYGIAIGWNVRRGRRQIECGCGGPPQQLSYRLVARNLCLALLVLVPVATLDTDTASGFLLVPMCASVFLMMAYLLFEQVANNAVAAKLPSA